MENFEENKTLIKTGALIKSISILYVFYIIIFPYLIQGETNFFYLRNSITILVCLSVSVPIAYRTFDGFLKTKRLILLGILYAVYCIFSYSNSFVYKFLMTNTDSSWLLFHLVTPPLFAFFVFCTIYFLISKRFEKHNIISITIV